MAKTAISMAFKFEDFAWEYFILDLKKEGEVLNNFPSFILHFVSD